MHIHANIAAANEALEDLREQVRQSVSFNEAARVSLEKAKKALAEAKG
jgi:regulator of replication initiation timing